MDIKQLRYFSTIAQEGQITRAAKKLHMAQPPLSHQLKSLEQELGVLLMERNGKNMELTEAGKVLYKRAKELLHRIDETVTEVKEVGDGLKGILSIGSVKTCFSYIPERLRFFREHYPMVTFRLHEGDSFRLAQYLKKRNIELAIVRLPLELNDFASLPLPADRFVVVIPEKWDARKTIQIKEIADMPLMLLHRVSGIGLYELVVDKCRKHGFEPNVVCQCPDASMLLSLVRAGAGATLLPRSTLLSFPSDGLKVMDIEDCMIESESAVIWLKDRYLSKNAVRFIETFNQ
ncbi:LysR family transcriptional regulator [Aneurinibacillus migulanus]|uniref:DNA-binding transcriptional regulator, LysR family n=1 Tax=Aneurinibacillus migulanus TaxID=47500 RepID=A0A0D1V1V6_ANEMI|nr:LysR family transcriptional regulator [Aneurinibacillus migulanus]KIV53354.1 LysR family transcriptional regulator [Aneurinibacillus migulanus]KIV57917.1 LysR family transcriptional regulator [Aneurinibacillus migulanus]KON97321.1 LysR family transcriptional regulator [Aneurinibacillus migulanus]KPD05188.1 LysR family transcriptional regulator [Aneurinibacillus migulanus]MCP1356303.1 LysR family transcriptional regulator [Aneurinibacillus migulanus]